MEINYVFRILSERILHLAVSSFCENFPDPNFYRNHQVVGGTKLHIQLLQQKRGTLFIFNVLFGGYANQKGWDL